MRAVAVALAWSVVGGRWTVTGAQSSPTTDHRPPSTYYLFVASEGNDRIALVSFGPNGAKVERERRIGLNPTELLGPHGVALSPDGKYYYVTTAHGTPFGALWKYTTDRDSLVGKVPITNVNELLQARTAGVQVIQGTGQTGASSSIVTPASSTKRGNSAELGAPSNSAIVARLSDG